MSGVIRSKPLLALIISLLAAALLTTTVAYAAITSRQPLASGSGLKYEFTRTSADSFDSGWHVHPGLVVVQVEEGSFQFTQATCTPKTVGAGETFIEVPWKPVRAVATGAVKWTVSIFVPATEQISIPYAAYSGGQAPPCP
jgi:hypothetical protein